MGRWRETLGENPNSKQRDTAEFANLAKQRYYADSGEGQPYISDTADMRAYIESDPDCEVAGFVLLKSDWFPATDVIGLCHFRRTWCNNLVIDYLSSHPLLHGRGEDPRYKVSGVGGVLMCFVSRLAVEWSCDRIWGEATPNSHGFYEYIFRLDSVKDLFVIPKDNFTMWANSKLDWQSEQEANTIQMEAAKESYAVEEAHPPLVGNRTQMVGSRRQLINHFLDLPRNVQEEVAQALGLLGAGDSNIKEDQWCRILFQRARESGKLRDLWDEVEKRHDNGEPEKNPF